MRVFRTRCEARQPPSSRLYDSFPVSVVEDKLTAFVVNAVSGEVQKARVVKRAIRLAVNVIVPIPTRVHTRSTSEPIGVG